VRQIWDRDLSWRRKRMNSNTIPISDWDCIRKRRERFFLLENAGFFLFDLGEVAAISRWLSAAIPPIQSIPEGSQQAFGQTCCDPSGIVPFFGSRNRWCRCAQPPANRYDPSGIGTIETQNSFTALHIQVSLPLNHQMQYRKEFFRIGPRFVKHQSNLGS
jgi:hypothetical protein